jgi:futalosine hydrolase
VTHTDLRLLILTSVRQECEAIRAALSARRGAAARVVVGGVGPACAAAAASAELAREGADIVLCAGIGGGFGPLQRGDIAVASSIVFADLGADSPDGFLPVSALGFGNERFDVEAKLAVELTDLTGGHLGEVLTVATVTGTAARATQLHERFPQAVAEGMEGAGVAAAARLHGVAFAEVRAISNTVGPRERESWQIPRALVALGDAVGAIVEAGT